MRLKRLVAATLAMSALAFGVAILAANGRARAAEPASYICSPSDRQFISTVSSNLMQLGYWSDALVHNDVEPSVVVKQGKAEADQVGATRPLDRTLLATRDLIGSMFVEYSKAVALNSHGRDAGPRMASAWRLAGSVHELLAGAQAGLAAKGCDVAPLITS